MSLALALLRDRLAASPLAQRGLTFEAHDDAVGLACGGVDTGLRAAVRLVRVPQLDALRAEGRWVEASVPADAMRPAEAPVVVVVVDAAGRAVYATRDELLARHPTAEASDEPRQMRFAALVGLGGFGLHRLILLLAGAPPDAGPPRVRALLRRFVEQGDAFEATADEVVALGLPPWFVAAHAAMKDESTLAFAMPAYSERLAIELRGATETLAVRDVELRCARGGTAQSTWSNDHATAALGLTLRLDHARTAIELKVALLATPGSAGRLASAARFVWRFGQGGRVTLLPACAAAALPVGSVFAPQEAGAMKHEEVESLEALAALERATGTAFVLDPAALADPAQAEAVRELLLVRSAGRVERQAAAMRLSLTAAEVRRLLDASGHQRRVTFRMPPSRVSLRALGASVDLGARTQEVTGTLALPPAALAGMVAALAPDGRLDVELSAVELREFYEAPAAPTTAPTAARGAPSGSRSGST